MNPNMQRQQQMASQLQGSGVGFAGGKEGEKKKKSKSLTQQVLDPRHHMKMLGGLGGAVKGFF